MVGIQFMTETPPDLQVTEPALNAEVTQHTPSTLPAWVGWLGVAAAAITIYGFIVKKWK